MKKVSLVGLGYIGLPTAIVAAEAGYDVLGFDIDEEKIRKIAQGDPGIVEPGIAPRLAAVIASKKLRVFSDLQPADYFVVAVPTPFKSGKKADLSFVQAAARYIASVIAPSNVVILESTVPVGATHDFACQIEKRTGLSSDRDIFIAHCPERVLPGNIFNELIKNDRLIGGVGPKSARKAREFYAPFVQGELHVCDDKTAEMVKLVENSSRDVQIAFANQVAAMASTAGIDPFEVIELANKHPRVTILQPGCGVGGHCIAVDPWFLIEQFSSGSSLLKRARMINDARPREIVSDVMRLVNAFRKKMRKNPSVLLLGLTFKANIDDMRQSPALEIAHMLHKKTSLLNLGVCEPHVSSDYLMQLGLEPFELLEGVERSDIVVILVKHDPFKKLERSLLEGKEIIDACGLFYELDKLKRPAFFHAARTVNEREKEASLMGIQKNLALK